MGRLHICTMKQHLWLPLRSLCPALCGHIHWHSSTTESDASPPHLVPITLSCLCTWPFFWAYHNTEEEDRGTTRPHWAAEPFSMARKEAAAASKSKNIWINVWPRLLAASGWHHCISFKQQNFPGLDFAERLSNKQSSKSFSFKDQVHTPTSPES